KYENDAKYARVHKRIMENRKTTKRESEIYETLMDIKAQADEKVLLNNNMLTNEGFFNQLMLQMVVNSFKKAHINLESDSARYINGCVVKEYINEFQGIDRW